jgi:hypothetical protein
MATLKALPRRNPILDKPVIRRIIDQPLHIFQSLDKALQLLSDVNNRTNENFVMVHSLFKKHREYTRIPSIKISLIYDVNNYFTSYEYEYLDIKTEESIKKLRIKLNRAINLGDARLFSTGVFIPAPPAIRDDITSGCYIEVINGRIILSKYIGEGGQAYRNGIALINDRGEYYIEQYYNGNPIFINKFTYKIFDSEQTRRLGFSTAYTKEYKDNLNQLLFRGPYLHGICRSNRGAINFYNGISREIYARGVSLRITEDGQPLSLDYPSLHKTWIKGTINPRIGRTIISNSNYRDIVASAIALIFSNTNNENFTGLIGRFVIYNTDEKIDIYLNKLLTSYQGLEKIAEGDFDMKSKFDGVIVYYKPRGSKFNGERYATVTYYNHGVAIQKEPDKPAVPKLIFSIPELNTQRRILNYQDLFLPFDVYSSGVIQAVLNSVNGVRELARIIIDYDGELVNISNNLNKAVQY